MHGRIYLEIQGRQYDLSQPLDDLDLQEVSRCYFIYVIEEQVEPEEYELYLSGMPLQVQERTSRPLFTSIKWVWDVEFFSGSIYPNLYKEGHLIWPTYGRKKIVVQPDVNKLVNQQFTKMLEEVVEIAYRLSPAFSTAKMGRGKRRLSLAQLEIVIIHLKKLLITVDQIARNPRKKLVRSRRSVPLHEVRQTDEQSIIALIQSTSQITRSDWKVPREHGSCEGEGFNHLSFEKVDEVTSRLSFDTFENAFLKGLLLRILNLTREWERQLKQVENSTKDDPYIYAVAVSRGVQVVSIRKEIQRRLELPFLHEVKPLDKVEKISVALIKDANYRLLYKIYRQLLLNVNPLGGDSLEISVERTYQLYEYWCYMKVVDAALQHYGETELDITELLGIEEDGGLTLKLQKGLQSVVTIQDRIKIYFQRKYPHYTPTKCGTYAFTMIPDIVVEFEDSEGHTRTVILDPKYRVGHSGIREAFGDMHKYKDALVDNELSRIVRGAYILVPNTPRLLFNQDNEYKDFTSDSYKLRHGFGICVLTPGEESRFEDLWKMIEQLTGYEPIQRFRDNFQ